MEIIITIKPMITKDYSKNHILSINYTVIFALYLFILLF
jgi:hypothetical protein